MSPKVDPISKNNVKPINYNNNTTITATHPSASSNAFKNLPIPGIEF